MNVILAILLYLHVIVPNGTYTSCQIDQMQDANATQISNIENNNSLNDEIQIDYGPATESITIIDQTCN